MGVISGKKLKYYRNRAKLTQKELADLSEVSASYIQKIELKERAEPSMEIVIRLGKALNIAVEALYPHIVSELYNNNNNFKCLYEAFHIPPTVIYEVIDLELINEIIKVKRQFDKITKIVHE